MLFLSFVIQTTAVQAVLSSFVIQGSYYCVDAVITQSGLIVSACQDFVTTTSNFISINFINGTQLKKFTWKPYNVQLLNMLQLDTNEVGVFTAGYYQTITTKNPPYYAQMSYVYLNGSFGYSVSYCPLSLYKSSNFYAINVAAGERTLLVAGYVVTQFTNLQLALLQKYDFNGTLVTSYVRDGASQLSLIYDVKATATYYYVVGGVQTSIYSAAFTKSLSLQWEVVGATGQLKALQYLPISNTIIVSGELGTGTQTNVYVSQMEAKNGSIKNSYTQQYALQSTSYGIFCDEQSKLVSVAVDLFSASSATFQSSLQTIMLLGQNNVLSNQQMGTNYRVFYQRLDPLRQYAIFSGYSIANFQGFVFIDNNTFVSPPAIPLLQSSSTSSLPGSTSISSTQTSSSSNSLQSSITTALATTSSKPIVSSSYVPVLHPQSMYQTLTTTTSQLGTSTELQSTLNLEQYSHYQVDPQSSYSSIVPRSRPVELGSTSNASLFIAIYAAASIVAFMGLLSCFILWRRRVNKRVAIRKYGGVFTASATVLLDQTIPLQDFTDTKLDKQDKFVSEVNHS